MTVQPGSTSDARRTDGPGPDPALSVGSRHEGDRLVLDVVGEIDEWTCSHVLVAVRQALLESERVALDLSGVAFIGSAGLSALLQLHAHAERHRRDLEIVRVSATVQRAIDLAHLGEVLRASPPG